MSESLFDDPFVGTATMSVRDLTQIVALALDQAFPDDVWVIGEISGLNRSATGHVYFDLVEPAATPGAPVEARLAVVLFSATRSLVNQSLKKSGGMRMTDGMRVRIRAAVDFYPPQGRLQLRMTGIDPAYTLGALALEREALLRRLRAEGLTERNAGRPLTLVPLRVGLVTSANSAAAADFLTELEHSGFAWHVVVCDTRVQGAGADTALARAVIALGHRNLDAIAVVRGGGSKGDLIPFDAEELARAIAASPVPVFTGIGHEIDRSVADDVAHRAAKTPTACAAALVDRVRSFTRLLDEASAALGERAPRPLAIAEHRLERRAHRIRSGSQSALQVEAAFLAGAADRIERSARRTLDRSATLVARQPADLLSVCERRLAAADRHVGHVDSQVAALDPRRMLARGWSITTDSSGRAVRAASEVAAGDTITTRLADGTISSTVQSTAAPTSTPGDRP